ncbi:MTRF1L release factor glutamine methyltransferase isoform X4 [Dendropsophus ebraccatus]|uniref:MTRF1L release factor glutamine methyltransferase isoform X4 n=1 Tax=Dendropsophus ebraccatus TaxID=150705 RepID=UPI003831A204
MHFLLRQLLAKFTSTQVPCQRISTYRMTPDKLASYWEKVFLKHAIPEPEDSSCILVAHALGAKTFHSIGPSAACSPVPVDQMFLVEKMAQERLKRVPVQYIIGEWDFLDMTLEMRPPVLIPRPETEELVGLMLADCEDLHHSTETTVLEVGCGSGAVSLALLRRIPQLRVIATDKSEAAVSLTQDNAKRLGLLHRIHILRHNILTDPIEQLQHLGPVSAVVSNPPYIFTEDMTQLEPEILSDIFLEVDPRHPELVKKWLEDHPEEQLQLLNIVKDFCNNSSLHKFNEDVPLKVSHWRCIMGRLVKYYVQSIKVECVTHI